MYLEKWYADVVLGGRAKIRYRANLHLGPLVTGYCGSLANGRTSTTRIGMHRLPLPTVAAGKLHWPGDADNEPIVWHSAFSRPRTLWESRGRQITWDPIVLSGNAVTTGQNPCGRGYVERLTLNFAPWDLGLENLKWGRFCGQQHSLVWIEWRGVNPMRLALFDGEVEPLRSADRREIKTANARLAIGSPLELTREPLAQGALRTLGWLRMIATRRFLSGIETKWIAEANLEIRGRLVDRGSVVYEEVQWR